MASAEENASNPLAAVNNVDLSWQFTSADPGDKHDFFVDGASSRSAWSSRRMVAMFRIGALLAKRPEWRMRWKPVGKTWRRKRQMNSVVSRRIGDHLVEMVRGTLEEALNAIPDAEADRLSIPEQKGIILGRPCCMLVARSGRAPL
jgi:hypothetical protein